MNVSVVQQGASAPLGATIYPGGVNFSIFSKNATLVELLLFDEKNNTQPAAVIPLDPNLHRTYHYWHVFVPDLRPGQIYGYRAHGPFAPRRGFRFDGEKVHVLFGATEIQIEVLHMRHLSRLGNRKFDAIPFDFRLGRIPQMHAPPPTSEPQ